MLKKFLKKLTSKKSVQPKRKPSVEKPIGKVTHFFGNIKVAVVKFKKPMKIGMKIKIKGATTDFSQNIVSMQFNHVAVKSAKKNQSLGMKVLKKVREGDLIFEG